LEDIRELKKCCQKTKIRGSCQTSDDEKRIEKGIGYSQEQWEEDAKTIESKRRGQCW
jgi:hypothetical protein